MKLSPHAPNKEYRVTWKQRWRQEGGGQELLRLALPLILSNSFLTLQMTIDRALLSQYSIDAVAASWPAALLYWTPMALFQNIANYATTFVAQYSGANRLDRVGPAVWQALHFSVVVGIAFLGLLPLAVPLIALGGHSAEVQTLEVTYFQYLCFAALPALLVASANSFFAGRGDSWTVLLNDAVGLAVNTTLANLLIFGRFGLPRMGIAGAGVATVAGTTTSAVLALTLLMRKRYRSTFCTLSGWRFDPQLFARMMRYGFPNGLQWMLDCLAFTIFLFLVGRLGEVEQAATNITFSINMMGLLPMLGIGQAVGVLVGQRLGQDRPDIAERTTWTGLQLAGVYIGTACIAYFAIPHGLMYVFRNDVDSKGPEVEALVPILLHFASVYSLADCGNIVFSFALRGAGDTRFVTFMVLSLAWPLMVVPTWAAWYFGWGLYWAWTFASAYIIALGVAFLLRFRAGKWKSMRVIEREEAEEPDGEAATIPQPAPAAVT
jgi:MATE family multidrug resistance protein